MAQVSKRQKALAGKIDRNKNYPITDALALVKDAAKAKFNESVDVSVNLGVDAKKSDQVVRGSVVLPAGTGKSVRVAVFAQGAKAEDAKAAGAEIVGTASVTVDTTAANVLDLIGTWSVANAGNVARLDAMTVEIIG